MSKKFVFRRVADAEFVESAGWYEDQRLGLGQDFISEVQGVLDNIAANPHRYPVVFKDIREGLVSEFPYCVYYRVKADRIIVTAVFHTSRDPAVWQSRK